MSLTPILCYSNPINAFKLSLNFTSILFSQLHLGPASDLPSLVGFQTELRIFVIAHEVTIRPVHFIFCNLITTIISLMSDKAQQLYKLLFRPLSLLLFLLELFSCIKPWFLRRHDMWAVVPWTRRSWLMGTGWLFAINHTRHFMLSCMWYHWSVARHACPPALQSTFACPADLLIQLIFSNGI